MPTESVTSTAVISAAVMAHPRRAAEAARLAASLPAWGTRVVVDPSPEAGPGALRTARAAWAAVAPGATHHVVLQDDVVPCREFAAQVAHAVRELSDTPLALYANWNSWNGAATRAAALQGASWVPAVPGEWTPSLALVLPRADVDALLAAVPPDVTGPDPDDTVLARELGRRGRRVLIPVPHWVEHADGTSLVGNDVYGPRHSACFADDTAAGPDPAGPVAAAPDVLVHLFKGRVQLVLAADTRTPRRSSREGYLRAAGLDGRSLRRSARAVAALRAPSALLGALCEEIWYAAYLMALHTPAGRAPGAGDDRIRLCLRSLVLGGTADRADLRLWALHRVSPLMGLAEDGLRAGFEDREAYGRPAPLPPDQLAALPDAALIWSHPLTLEER
ncbi:hypothetical protein OHB31_10465 [Streptomyces microflavus]|uniref:hypothetical protein n=1 Tax=Streptomyces microflavus TaxID=1919 RepID=UPI002DDC3FD1|nr:hypothetical protein [Streptomyces microflavus]WSA60567.1 hypothetical protein OHB31_10465 [Streptomyces microflavus]